MAAAAATNHDDDTGSLASSTKADAQEHRGFKSGHLKSKTHSVVKKKTTRPQHLQSPPPTPSSSVSSVMIGGCPASDLLRLGDSPIQDSSEQSFSARPAASSLKGA